MRERLVIGNWKMHTNLPDAVVLATRIRNGMHAVPSDVTVAICPPTVWLYPIAEVIEHSAENLKLGAQNLWPGKDGRYTGEVSASQLSQLAQFAIVGHSERRVYQREDNILIGKKVRGALRYAIRPIVCVGEFRRLTTDRSGRLKPRRGDAASDIFEQLRDAVQGMSKEELSQVIVAYEPVWAIGGSQPAELPYVESVLRELRSTVDDYLGAAVSADMTMLYGGSVTAQNADRFAHAKGLDGLLVGGASLNAGEFLSIASAFHTRRSQ